MPCPPNKVSREVLFLSRLSIYPFSLYAIFESYFQPASAVLKVILHTSIRTREFFFNEIVTHEHASPFTRTIALRNRISSKLIINYCLATLASSITSLSATSPTFGPFQESCSAFILLNNNFLLEFDCVAGFRTSLLSS